MLSTIAIVLKIELYDIQIIIHAINNKINNLHRNKLIIGLHTDIRAAFIGSKLNPMIRVPLEYIATTEKELLQVLRDYQNCQVITDEA